MHSTGRGKAVLKDANMLTPHNVPMPQNYWSPEIVAAEEAGVRMAFTVASDMWAVGVGLFEMLTGRCCFSGRDETAIRAAIMTNAIVENTIPGVSEDAQAVCRCLVIRIRYSELSWWCA